MISENAKVLLQEISAKYPDPMTVSSETDDLFALREADLILQWDLWPDGRRRWMVTPQGTALARNPK